MAAIRHFAHFYSVLQSRLLWGGSDNGSSHGGGSGSYFGIGYRPTATNK